MNVLVTLGCTTHFVWHSTLWACVGLSVMYSYIKFPWSDWFRKAWIIDLRTELLSHGNVGVMLLTVQKRIYRGLGASAAPK